MGSYTIFLKFENPRRGRQARNFSENDPNILDLKSSSEKIIFRKLSLGAPDAYVVIRDRFIQVHFSDTNNIKVTLKLQCPPILFRILQILGCVTRRS